MEEAGATKWRRPGATRSWEAGDDVKRVKQEQQKATKVAEANKTAPSPTQPVKPKYDFYTLLPESEVLVPPEAVYQIHVRRGPLISLSTLSSKRRRRRSRGCSRASA